MFTSMKLMIICLKLVCLSSGATSYFHFVSMMHSLSHFSLNKVLKVFSLRIYSTSHFGWQVFFGKFNSFQFFFGFCGWYIIHIGWTDCTDWNLWWWCELSPINEASANQPLCCFRKRAKTELEREQKLDQETLPKYLPLGQFFAPGTTYFWQTSSCVHSYKVVSITYMAIWTSKLIKSVAGEAGPGHWLNAHAGASKIWKTTCIIVKSKIVDPGWPEVLDASAFWCWGAFVNDNVHFPEK